MEAELNSTPATAAEWTGQALNALDEAMQVSDSIAYMLDQLDNALGNPPEAHVPLEIISERARRRGSPEWSPSLPLWPEPKWQKKPPAFKPMRSWPRRWP